MVVGIVAVVLCAVFLPGVVAIGLGIAGMSKAAKLGGAKKGQALAGIILGVLSIALGVGTWFLVRAAVDKSSDVISDVVDDALGVADPDTYEIKIGRCELDQSGNAIAEGTIRNTPLNADRGSAVTRNYQIEVEFIQQGEVVDTGTVLALDVAPRDTQTWTIDGSVAEGGTVRCSVVAVNNFLN